MEKIASPHPKFSHLSLSKVLRTRAYAHMDEESLLITVFDDMYLCERDAAPEKQRGKAVSKDQMYFEQILRVQLEEKVRLKAFEKNPD